MRPQRSRSAAGSGRRRPGVAAAEPSVGAARAAARSAGGRVAAAAAKAAPHVAHVLRTRPARPFHITTGTVITILLNISITSIYIEY
eukprot:SAG31_NODE_4990_length_2816_cov_3.224880_1_plen_87_part_00